LDSNVETHEDLIWLTPTPGRVIEIVDEQARVCPVGVIGDLRIMRTPLDASEYLNDPAATSKMFRGPYFYPGDLAVQRPDGRIRILGRAGDVLNVQGQKLPCAPIEQDLQRTLAAAEVCLFSGLDDKGEELLIIAVEAACPPPKAAMDEVVQTLNQFGAIRFAIVPNFPRTKTGTRKVDRLALRQLVWSSTAGA
jgi:acyl-coenzyme A synthetase/AMP-(fatty) acid ligase